MRTYADWAITTTNSAPPLNSYCAITGVTRAK